MRTSDLFLAAFLLAKGHDILRLEGKLPRREFVFGEIPDTDLTLFHRGDPSVTPRQLMEAHARVKVMLHEADQAEGIPRRPFQSRVLGKGADR